tara:strand:- start:1120 stop:1956 length:837 start_codon:yes stop_codon:yes gene_type:complete
MKKYLSLIKFSHTIFAMPFAFIGFFLASEKEIDWVVLTYIILCMILARSAAMAFNRYIDRKIDKKNSRTSKREIASGIIKPNHALIFVIINSLLFIICTYFINSICFYLSPIALLIILGYSLTKRFTSLCHFILGIGLSLTPIGAYLAVNGSFSSLPLLFSLVVLLWVSGFDIIYALQDEEFDKAEHLYSIPVVLGKKNALKLSQVLHSLTFVTLLYIGFVYEFQIHYWIGCIIFSSLLIYQHTLVKLDNLQKIDIIFFTTNGIGSIIFGIFVILDLI